MKKWAGRVIVGMAVVGSLIPFGGVAQASTCAVGDPTLHYVVCDTVVSPTMRVVCTAINKAGLDCFA